MNSQEFDTVLVLSRECNSTIEEVYTENTSLAAIEPGACTICVTFRPRFLKMQEEKNWVQLSRLGSTAASIHRRCPTTERRGNFWLLPFGPGPVRSSLDNLDSPSSQGESILTPNLVRTPDQHRPHRRSAPSLKPFANPGLQVTGLQTHATTPGRLWLATSCRYSFLHSTAG